MKLYAADIFSDNAFSDDIGNFVEIGEVTDILIIPCAEIVNTDAVLSTLKAKFPMLNKTIVHPMTRQIEMLSYVIVSLNDKYKWFPAKIAGWLESLDIDLSIND
jgi:hypothetical protein